MADGWVTEEEWREPYGRANQGHRSSGGPVAAALAQVPAGAEWALDARARPVRAVSPTAITAPMPAAPCLPPSPTTVWRSSMFIKICGCRRAEDVAAAAAAGASAIGMILAPGHRRTLGLDEAARLRRAVPAGVLAVGVFLDQPLEEVRIAVRAVGCDAVQLHGREPEDYREALRADFPLIAAWNLEDPAPLAADWVLVEPHAGRSGGAGRQWDWGRAHGLHLAAPMLLGGGLTPANVAAACDAALPFGVDVSSGVEVGGRKDPSRISLFCEAVRRWEEGRAQLVAAHDRA